MLGAPQIRFSPRFFVPKMQLEPPQKLLPSAQGGEQVGSRSFLQSPAQGNMVEHRRAHPHTSEEDREHRHTPSATQPEGTAAAKKKAH
eukprot:1804738-Rhodomonas_salina.1